MRQTLNINGVTFDYNSDYSGDVEIMNLVTLETIKIPCTALMGFVAEYVRKYRISVIQDMPPDVILHRM